jgi:hypothetical protein
MQGKIWLEHCQHWLVVGKSSLQNYPKHITVPILIVSEKGDWFDQ